MIAGSSRGIGKAIAATLLDEGARVCITGRNREALDQAVQTFAKPDHVLAAAGDLSQRNDIEAVFQQVQARWGAIDGMIANLGTGSGKPGWDQPEDEWERLLLMNLRASVRLAQACIPFFGRGGGNILFIASIVGMEATPAPLPYSAAKAALRNYSKNLSRQVAKQGIRVNCIAPGNILFQGGSWERHLANRPDAVKHMIETEVPLARFGKPEEIASLAAFLCSPRAGFITGACFVADGGQTRSL